MIDRRLTSGAGGGTRGTATHERLSNIPSESVQSVATSWVAPHRAASALSVGSIMLLETIPKKCLERLPGRFVDRIAKDPDRGCWLWQSNTNKGGYSTIKIAGRRMLGHRLAFELWRGPIANGMMVLHSCDVRHCVNPAHLRLGTAADNMADLRERGPYWLQQLERARV